ncbi:MAG: transcription antitermination factor NusB [Acidobacteriota bacterium]
MKPGEGRRPVSRPAPPRRNLRALAARLLEEILGANQSLKGVVQREQARLTREDDRALLRELVAGPVRTLPFLDWAIKECTARGPERTQRELLHILRVGAYQILCLDRIPAYAAVHECVEAAKSLNPGAGGFVNGILRSLSEKRGSLLDARIHFPGAEGAALRNGAPLWLALRYERRFGEQGEALLRALAEPASTSILFMGTGAEARGLPILERQGFKLTAEAALPLTYRVDSGNPADSEAFALGLFYVMDPASQIPALLLPVPRGGRVLDLCAAPGGKTIRLALRTGDERRLVAADRNRRRLRQMAQNLRRLGFPFIRLVAAEAPGPLPFTGGWDGVLVDAPCSSLGTLRRNPEIRWQTTEADLARHGARQGRLLSAAADLVKPGGHLLYSVCSIEPEETLDPVQALLATRSDFVPEALKAPEALEPLLEPAGVGRAFVLPSKVPWDGFFVALLKRKGGRAKGSS